MKKFLLPAIAALFCIPAFAQDADIPMCVMTESTPENGAAVESLESISMTWMSGTAYAEAGEATIPVYNASGVEVSSIAVDYTSQKKDWSTWPPTWNYELTPNPAITENGTYSFTIPAGLFIADPWGTLGQEGVNGGNAPLVFTFTIGSGETPSNLTYDLDQVTVSPANNSSLSYENGQSLGSFNLTFGVDVALNPEFTPYLVLADESHVSPVNYKTMGNLGMGNVVIVGFEDADKFRSGEIKLVVPAGAIGTLACGESGFTSGSVNPALEYSYTWTENPSLSAGGDDGTPFEMLKCQWIGYQGAEPVDLMVNDPLAAISLKTNCQFLVSSNKNDISGGVHIQIYDPKDYNPETDMGEVIYQWWTYSTAITSVTDLQWHNGKNADGEFITDTFPFNMNVLYNDTEYAINVTFWNAYDGIPKSDRVCYGSWTGKFTGTGQRFQYSDVDMLSINPQPKNICWDNLEDMNFTMTFSAPVECDLELSKALTALSMGNAYDLENVTYNEDKTQWSFKIPALAAASAEGVFYTKMRFTDENGKILRPAACSNDNSNPYNQGSENNTYQVGIWEAYFGGREIVVSPEAGEAEILKDFTFTCPSANKKAIGFAGISSSGKLIEAELFDANGEAIDKLDRNDFLETMEGSASEPTCVQLDMHLTQPVTTTGTYRLHIPGAYFMTGTEMNAKANKPMDFVYILKDIENGVGQVGAALAYSVVDGNLVLNAPASVYALDGTLVAKGQAGETLAIGQGIYVVAAEGAQPVKILF